MRILGPDIVLSMTYTFRFFLFFSHSYFFLAIYFEKCLDIMALPKGVHSSDKNIDNVLNFQKCRIDMIQSKIIVPK